jgi:ankyrin repeat protein
VTLVQKEEYDMNALEAASSEGHAASVEILLNNGADVNAQTLHHGNALQVASSRGHEAIVQILLDQDADVNARTLSHRYAL